MMERLFFLNVPIFHSGLFYVIPYIQRKSCQKIKNQWKTYRQKRRIDKEQSYFRRGYIELFSQIGTNPERIPLKKNKYSLNHLFRFKIFAPMAQFKHFF